MCLLYSYSSKYSAHNILQNRIIKTLLFGFVIFVVFFVASCSNQKNTGFSRFYHSLNTRYNIHFNADKAFDEALEAKKKSRVDNFSELLYIYPDYSDTASLGNGGGAFTVTIDKATKAIKLHSIKTKPRRNPKRRNDERYQAWLQQKEFNPFMHNVWMLLAKAEFEDNNFLRAISTFMYITKIYSTNPDLVAECKLWIARSYTEMGWMYEAGNVLHKLELAGGVPESQKAFYASVKANYLIRNKELETAIPYLEHAIETEKDKQQKTRMKFLLAQIYEKLGYDEKAYVAFGNVSGMNTEFKYAFNAKLRQLEMGASKDKAKALASLEKMTKSSVNKEYLDQIHFAMGNIYLNEQDTVKAVEQYNKAIKESTRNGLEKMACEIALADIYFAQRKFVLAQPHYAAALGQLKKTSADYPRVSLRSAVLDELVVHVKVVQEQDSLQHLARLPEVERMEIINNKILQIKREEEARRKAEERQKQVEEREARIESWGDLQNESLFITPPSNVPQQPQIPFGQQDPASSFYFYNEQTVAQGKVAFQKNWGNRKLEDDWRRKDKLSSGLDNNQNLNTEDLSPEELQKLLAEADQKDQGQQSNAQGQVGSATNTDIYSPEYYLQQLPLTPEAIKASDVLIENALFNMGKIYKDKLEDMALAIDAFTKNINRFPDSPNLEEIYYQLFLIYMQMGNDEMMAIYRNKLLNEFPQGIYAAPLLEPDYEWNFRHMAALQAALYEATYEAYLAGDIRTVRENYQSIKSKYPFAVLMPKFAFLNALTYAQTRDANQLRDNLKELVEKYPKEDVTPLATEILDRIKDGKILLSDGSPLRGIDWSYAYAKDSTDVEGGNKPLEYSAQLNTPYILLLMYPSKKIDRNELLFDVADYNFSNYVVQVFDLAFAEDPPVEMLQIKGFESFSYIKSYLNRAFEEGNLISKLDSSITVVPISAGNYDRVFPRLGFENYVTFFADSLGNQLPQLVAYWNKTKLDMESLNKELQADKTPVPQTETKVEERPKPPVIVVPQEKPKTEQPQKQTNDKEINADDLLTKDQLGALGKANDVIEAAEEIINNPVDGIKNLFNKYKDRQKLTKEEKAELKEEERIEKQRQKELQAIAKAKQDSIDKVEKTRLDAIKQAEKAKQDSIDSAEKIRQEELRAARIEKENEAKAALKAKDDIRKAREAERKEKERLQKERLRERERERKEKEKARERERKQKEKEANERRKQQAKNRSR